MTISSNLLRPAWTEADRLAALHRYAILDTPREAEFDDIAQLAAQVFEAPIAVVNLIADGRQWFKAEVGIGARELPLDVSICAHAILQADILVVPDLREDGRFCCNPLVAAAEGALRFYAGALLRTVEGLPIGTVCVLDTQPRPAGVTERQRLTLEVLARQVMTQLELRRLLAQSETETAKRTAERDRMWRLSQDLLIAAEIDGTIVAVNAAWTKLLGWTEEDLVGTSFVEFTHPDDLARTLEVFAAISDAPLSTPYEYRFRSKDGSYRWFAWTAAFENGRVYANGRHTTTERETSEALCRTEEALRQAQKMEAVGQLTGGIAHDFNNLLAGISGSLELIERRIAQERFAGLDRFIGAAQASSRRAASLTQRLLAFSRQQTLDPKPTDVNKLVFGMEDLIRRTVGPAVTVEVVGAAGLWPALIDPSQLESALLNLAINARDAMPEGGRITIETANKWLDDRGARERELPAGQYLSVCVTDSGTGMAKDLIERIFDPFFTTKPIGQGTGLGLSMIHGFVRQSGGQVRVYSEVGQGTTMCLYLPRHVGEVSEAADVEDPTIADSGGGETVLVIDDEPTVRMLIVEVLHEAGYRALEAEDGLSGLRILQSDARIDLLITDVGLPGGMNGRQVADAARQGRPDLKILFVTGYAENAAVGNGHLDLGMEVITKPFAMTDLANKISEMI